MTTEAERRHVLEAVGDLPDDDLGAVEAFLGALAHHRTRLSAVRASTGPSLPGLPDVAPVDLRAAMARNEARLWAVREELYDTALPRTEAAERMGVSANQVTNLLRSGDLVAMDGADGLRLPAWQFHPEARRGRLDGIRQVVEAFPGGVLGLSSWMATAHPVVAGRTPRQALVDGDIEWVVAAAAATGQ